mmetsp:Transcript_14328/g.47063  ORF Transcript_14328/g.47063 Transcript_14328/m.47063 type:complete len:148 (-) Transcript_14328:33-476(-)
MFRLWRAISKLWHETNNYGLEELAMLRRENAKMDQKLDQLRKQHAENARNREQMVVAAMRSLAEDLDAQRGRLKNKDEAMNRAIDAAFMETSQELRRDAEHQLRERVGVASRAIFDGPKQPKKPHKPKKNDTDRRGDRGTGRQKGDV